MFVGKVGTLGVVFCVVGVGRRGGFVVFLW